MADQRFQKNLKLKKKSELDLLFSKGKWKSYDNMRIISYKFAELDVDDKKNYPKIGVSAPKKNFKKAVDRNYIKRLLREAYRLNKKEYSEKFGENSMAMIFWSGRGKPANLSAVVENFLQLCNSNK